MSTSTVHEPVIEQRPEPAGPPSSAGPYQGPGGWGSFAIDGAAAGRGPIRLEQRTGTTFSLSSTITYRGVTGLEGNPRIPPSSMAQIRTVTPEQLTETDLASVPPVLRWFVGPYGVHTPAALIHDRLIGLDPPIDGVTEQDADRYFRFMLDDLGVRFILRWLMWAAVAFRTRFVTGASRYLLVTWLIMAGLGTAVLVDGVMTGSWPLVVGAILAPVPLSALWGRQYGAGLVAAYLAVPWVLVPTVFAGAFYGCYRVAEHLLWRVSARRRHP